MPARIPVTAAVSPTVRGRLARALAVSCCVGALGMSGCVFAPSAYTRPDPHLRDDARPMQVDASKRWWATAYDTTLVALIDEALARNQDILVALGRIQEARAEVLRSEQTNLPSASLQLSADRGRTPPANLFAPANTLYGRAQISYELDLWQRYASRQRASASQARAAVFDAQALHLTLIGEVAAAYYSLHTTRRLTALAVERRALLARALAISRAQLEQGASTWFDVETRQQQLIAAEVDERDVSAEAKNQGIALATLLGRDPNDLRNVISSGEVEVIDAEQRQPAAGISADVVLRRPDVLAAEQRLMAAHDDVEAARRAYLPTIDLAAFAGKLVSSTVTGTIPFRVWDLGASLAQPIFNTRSLDADLDGARARRSEALALYSKTVTQAVSETLQALIDCNRNFASRTDAGRQVAIAKAQLQRTKQAMAVGRQAESQLIAAQLQLIDRKKDDEIALRDARLGEVNLMRAAGGAIAAR